MLPARFNNVDHLIKKEMKKLIYTLPAAAIVFAVCAIVHVVSMVLNHQLSINHLIN